MKINDVVTKSTESKFVVFLEFKVIKKITNFFIFIIVTPLFVFT